MPVLNDELLDDPMLSDACPGFAGGMRSWGPPDQLQVTEAAELLNTDICDGTATTRRGTIAVGATLPGPVRGLCWYDTPAGEQLVACANGVLYAFDETNWSPFSTWTAASTGAQVSFAQLIDKLYLADGVSHLFTWDGSLLEDLGTGSSNQPPVGSILIAAQARLWVAGCEDVPDALYASAPLGAGWDTSALMIRIGSGEGDPITGLAEWDDQQIVVFKRNSIYLVRAVPSETDGSDGHTLANASVSRLSDTIGCVSHRSIARVGTDVWFLSDAGVFSVGRVIAQTQREIKDPASTPVQDVIRRINWSAAGQSAATFWNNRYLLSLPLDDETAPGAVLVYDTQQRAWSGLWTGWSPLAWALSKAGGHERLNFGRGDGRVWRWLDFASPANETEADYRDDGVNITTSVTTRAMIFGDAFCEKNALSVQAEFYNSEAVATLSVRLNEDEPTELRRDLLTNAGTLLLPFATPALLPPHGVRRKAFGALQLPPFRSMQVRVESTAGKLSLRAIMASGFLNTLRLEE